MTTKPMVFEKNRLTISLRDLIGSETGWGHEQGANLARQIQTSLTVNPAIIVRLSLDHVWRMDVTCAGELVRLARSYRGQCGFCLRDVGDKAVFYNWHAAALLHGQSLFMWDEKMTYGMLGAPPCAGLEQVLQHVLSVPQTTTSEVAKDLGLKTQNASNKLKQLWMEGYILRQERSAESGGVEYEYLRIY